MLSFALDAGAEDIRYVRLGSNLLTLIGTPLQVGKIIPKVTLSDESMNLVSTESLKGTVTILSVVPSIDTAVCEKQTHILSEKNGDLDITVRLITVSRDLPFAQNRFKREAKTTNLTYLSDYREASFGKATGLLIAENGLLTRAVIVLDAESIVRYLEVVPNLGQLPQMENAFKFARSLL